MSAAEKRREARRNAILDAAEEIFADRGYHETGIADIAKKLGLGHGTFYRYFSNKHDIATSVLDRALAEFASIGLGVDPTASNTLEEYRAQVREILDGWLVFAEQRPRLVRLLLEQAHIVDMERLMRMTDLYTEFIAVFLRNGVEKGFLREDLEVRFTAEMLLGLIFEGCRRSLVTDDQGVRERWAGAGMALMFDGIRAR